MPFRQLANYVCILQKGSATEKWGTLSTLESPRPGARGGHTGTGTMLRSQTYPNHLAHFKWSGSAITESGDLGCSKHEGAELRRACDGRYLQVSLSVGLTEGSLLSGAVEKLGRI